MKHFPGPQKGKMKGLLALVSEYLTMKTERSSRVKYWKGRRKGGDDGLVVALQRFEVCGLWLCSLTLVESVGYFELV